MHISTDSDVEGYVLTMETYCRAAFSRTGIGKASESIDELTEKHAEQLYLSLISSVDPLPPLQIGKS